jgi:hypothetical protein
MCDKYLIPTKVVSATIEEVKKKRRGGPKLDRLRQHLASGMCSCASCQECDAVPPPLPFPQKIDNRTSGRFNLLTPEGIPNRTL